MENITAYTGEAHVTSNQFRGIIESIVGDGTYIANLDEQLEPELSTNNTLKIRSGVLIHHGHVMRVPPGTYDTVTYINGSQGMKRIDLVVARYEKNSETKKEPTKWVVIQGTPAASNPVAPVYNDGNMQNGDLLDDCPVFEMHFDGINVTEVKKLVEVTKNIDDLRKDVDKLNSTLANKVTINEWTNDTVTYRAFDTRPLNGLYGRIVLGTDGSFEIYQMNGGTWINKNSVVTQRAFPNYSNSIKLTDSTKTGINITQFGYLRASVWNSIDSNPNVALYINSSLVFEMKSQIRVQNGNMYPVSPGDIVDYYINMGYGDLYFFPCKD